MFVNSKTAKTAPNEEEQNGSKKTGKRAKTGSEDNQNEEDPISGSADDPNDMAFPNPGGSAAIIKDSAIQQNGSAVNNKTGKFNKFGSSGIQKNGSAQNVSGSSAAVKSSAMRQVHSESALTRAESGSGSGSGVKKSNSGSFGNPPNEEDEIENEISELVSNSKSLVLHT